MIRHIVALRFRAEVDQATRSALMAALGALRGHLPGILDFGHSPNVSPEKDVTHGFEQVFWFDFSDQLARDTYLGDPAHQAIGAQLVAGCVGGVDGIQVLDVVI